jgi:alkanesulfonate monooxygenase SsuD/methylene tetrahydromethanopterin reductase-like flavin-dependent oxidoreductase (luciferase family)
MRLGLVTLGDWLPDPVSGHRRSEPERFREFVHLGVLAEELGFDTFHVGEHHFSEYALSSPTPVLAAVAERTERVRLSTAVTLLAHHDAVRVAEDYATVDVLSGGRAELIAGRGVYHQHYDQFGQTWDRSEDMLAEAVRLLVRLWTERDVTWTGSFRPPLDGVTVHPRPVQQPHPPIWLSASSPESVERAVGLGRPIVIPTISTGVELPPTLARQYRQQWREAGYDPAAARVGLHVHGYVGETTTEAARAHWLPYQWHYLRWVVDEVRGPGTPMPSFMATLDEPDSQAVCGSVEDVLSELATRCMAMGGVDVLLFQCDQGGIAPEDAAGSIGRFANEVVPQLQAVAAATAPVLAGRDGEVG